MGIESRAWQYIIEQYIIEQSGGHRVGIESRAGQYIIEQYIIEQSGHRVGIGQGGAVYYSRAVYSMGPERGSIL